MNHNAAGLVQAIERGTRNMLTKDGRREAPPLDPKVTLDAAHKWKPHCSQMFRETMRQLRSQGVRVQDYLVNETVMRTQSESSSGPTVTIGSQWTSVMHNPKRTAAV